MCYSQGIIQQQRVLLNLTSGDIQTMDLEIHIILKDEHWTVYRTTKS